MNNSKNYLNVDYTELELTIKAIDECNPKFKSQIVLNQKQAALILGISEGTLQNWRTQKIGPEYSQLENGKGSRVMYSKIKLAQYILSRSIKTA